MEKPFLVGWHLAPKRVFEIVQELRFGSFSNGFKTLVHRKRVLVRSTRTCPPLSRISYLTQFIFEVQDKGPPLLFGSWLCHPYGARGSFSTLAFFVEVYTTGMKQVQYCAIIMFQGSSGSQVPPICQEIMLSISPSMRFVLFHCFRVNFQRIRRDQGATCAQLTLLLDPLCICIYTL